MRILSRASDLARLQAMLVGRALAADAPETDITYVTRSASGDRDGVTPLAAMPDKGAFTADLSDALASGDADLVVHSWKDLPLEGRSDTIIAATLERADPRDVIVVRRDVVDRRPPQLRVLSSSPRRAWLVAPVLRELLPWRVEDVRCEPVRGNVPTRLSRLMEGQGDALVVAKAALDRLIGFGEPFEEAAARVRQALDGSRWMVLPLRDVPSAPAQGAIAVEVRALHDALITKLRAISHAPTWEAVARERAVLAAHGGGCHAALGATVLPREYGSVISVRARLAPAADVQEWGLLDPGPAPPHADAHAIWPRPDERERTRRRSLVVAPPAGDSGYWVARADALPQDWRLESERFVWAAGGRTWRRLAARGIWVHGCADGLGEVEPPRIDLLAGRRIEWRRLTHAAAADEGALATYEVDDALPDDLPLRTHFFWTSGRQFRDAIARWPELRDRWHGTGPGRTRQAVCETLPSSDRTRVWLDYDDWYQEVTA